MKRIIMLTITIFILLSPARAITVLEGDSITISAPSAVLIEKSSGQLIFEKDAHTQRSPASVTKVMTLLLVMEAIEAGDLSFESIVTCSAHAASMGGSQIWLEEGEQMTVSDMIKAVSVVSANDCSVALAEHLAGSEEGFVARMNSRAAELGMKNTNFMDCSGLTDDPQHLTTAYDIALMSRELLSHEKIKDYCTIWMDSLRGGESELTNTNKLVRHYNGTTGLKTGFTQKAKYCLSASAKRDGTEFIAVVMHCETSTNRFESAKVLLNYAFANYAACSLRSPHALPPVKVGLGKADSVQPQYSGPESILLEKSAMKDLEYDMLLPESVAAPVEQGQVLGEMIVSSAGGELARVPLVASCGVERLSLWEIYFKLTQRLFAL